MDAIKQAREQLLRDLRGELTDLDRRMTRVESHCDTCRHTPEPHPGHTQD